MKQALSFYLSCFLSALLCSTLFFGHAPTFDGCRLRMIYAVYVLLLGVVGFKLAEK